MAEYENERRQPISGVISLDEFRDRLGNQEVQEALPPVEPSYHWADVQTYNAVRRVYGYLNGGAPDEGLGVFERLTTNEKGKVFIASERGEGEYFAVDKSRDQLESLIMELELYEDDEIERLGPAIERYYTTTLIAAMLIRLRYPVQPVRDIPQPVIGSRQYACETYEDAGVTSEEWMRLTRLRVAAGVSLQAVTHRNGKLRQDLKTYLGTVLENRYNYELAVQRTEELFNTEVPAEDQQGLEFLVAICNPIDSMFDVRRLIKRGARQQDASISSARS